MMQQYVAPDLQTICIGQAAGMLWADAENVTNRTHD